MNNYHGSAGSPVLYKDRIFLYQDHQGTANLKSFVAAFDVRTGETMWWKDRGPTFTLRRVNELKARVIASPALVEGTWYWRTDKDLLAIGP